MLSPIKEVITDITEMGIDQIISVVLTEETIVEKLPIIKWLILGKTIQNSIQNAHFIKKYSYFIDTINQQVKPIDFDKLLDNLKKDKNQKKLIENILIDINRYHTNQKAVLLGSLFIKTFFVNKFSREEYNRLRFSIDLMHPYDGINCLKKYYELKKAMENSSTENVFKNSIDIERVNMDFSPLSTTGLLKLPSGGSYIGASGGAYINSLGIKFYEDVVLSVIDNLDIDE